jgi:hypothetical protein
MCGKLITETRTHVHIDFEGGDRLKFGDIIVAVASMAVIFTLVAALLWITLVPMNTALGDPLNIVSILVSGLIVGYVFAGKIREESRMASIGKVVVLFAVVMLFAVIMWFAPVGHYGRWTDEYINSTYPSHGVTNEDWVAYENVVEFMIAGMYVALSLALGFIGLYIGSMRKPSTKT